MVLRAVRLLLTASLVWVPTAGVAIYGPLEPWEIYDSECPPGTKIVRYEDISYAGSFSEHGCLLPGEDHRAFEGPVYQSNGAIHERSMRRAGVREGRYRAWHLNGAQWAEGSYRQGEMSGPWILWYEDGTVAATGRYEGGERSGPWTFWHENGAKRSEGGYAHGTPSGRFRIWYADGGLWAEGEFLGPGVLDAETLARRREQIGPSVSSTWWEHTQHLYFRAEFRRGVRHGAWTQRSQDGSRVRKLVFERGALVAAKPPESLRECPDESDRVDRQRGFGRVLGCAYPDSTGVYISHGRETGWYPNGNPRWEGYLEHDVMVGPYRRWHENGALKQVGTYGERIMWTGALAGFDPEGRLSRIAHYRNQALDGCWSDFHPNGRRRLLVRYRDGERDGPEVEWSAPNQLGKVTYWKGGKSVRASSVFAPWSSPVQELEAECPSALPAGLAARAQRPKP